jgi:branched-chain amino acid transport system substrate-binding protein
VVDGARLYMQRHVDPVVGRKIEFIVRDDTAAKRLAQDMIVNDKVALIGAGITPSALTLTPPVAEAKISRIVMVSAASIAVAGSIRLTGL